MGASDFALSPPLTASQLWARVTLLFPGTSREQGIKGVEQPKNKRSEQTNPKIHPKIHPHKMSPPKMDPYESSPFMCVTSSTSHFPIAYPAFANLRGRDVERDKLPELGNFVSG